jgi:hypothetical protein
VPYGSVSPTCLAGAPLRAGLGSATKGGQLPAAQGQLKYGGRVGEARDDREDRPDGPDDLCGGATSRREAQSAGAGARPRRDGSRILRELEPTYQSRGMIRPLIRPSSCRLPPTRDRAGRRAPRRRLQKRPGRW